MRFGAKGDDADGNQEGPEVDVDRGRRGRLGAARVAFVSGIERPRAAALAHLRAGGIARERPRRCRLGPLSRAGRGHLRKCSRRGQPEARSGRARADQPLLRGKPGLSGALRPGLEPILRHGTRRQADRGRGAAARADGLALQPAAHREALPRSRLRRDRRPPAGARHRARRPDRRALGRLDGRHAACGPRGTPARARPGAIASGRVFERRRARDEILRSK